jgi:hypothetical protein
VTEHQSGSPQVSPAVQQALGKLNVRLADFMEQVNIVISVLVNENAELRAKLADTQTQQQQPPQ